VSDPVSYTAVLTVSAQTVPLVSGLLATERRRRGTRRLAQPWRWSCIQRGVRSQAGIPAFVFMDLADQGHCLLSRPVWAFPSSHSRLGLDARGQTSPVTSASVPHTRSVSGQLWQSPLTRTILTRPGGPPGLRSHPLLRIA